MCDHTFSLYCKTPHGTSDGTFKIAAMRPKEDALRRLNFQNIPLGKSALPPSLHMSDR